MYWIPMSTIIDKIENLSGKTGNNRDIVIWSETLFYQLITFFLFRASLHEAP